MALTPEELKELQGLQAPKSTSGLTPGEEKELNALQASNLVQSNSNGNFKDTMNDVKDDLVDRARGLTSGTTLGTQSLLGGAIQGGLDKGQSLLNKMGLASPSPSQVNNKLAKMGITGDVGPTDSIEMMHQGEDDTNKDFNQSKDRSPIAYGASALLGGAIAGGGLNALGAKAVAAVPALGGAAPLAANAPLASRLAQTGVNALKTAGVAGSLGFGSQLAGGQNNLVGKDKNIPAALKSAASAGLLSGLIGGTVSGSLGAAGDVLGSTTAGKAFGQAIKGKKLIGPAALDEATEAIKNQAKNANEAVESLRKNVAGPKYEEAISANPNVPVTDTVDEIAKDIKAVSGTTPEAPKEIKSLLGTVEKESPFTPIKPKYEHIESQPIEPNMVTEPAKPGTLETLTQKGELAIQNEKALGNNATYQIVPGKTSDGQKTLSLVIQKEGSPAAGATSGGSNPVSSASTELESPAIPETTTQDGFKKAGPTQTEAIRKGFEPAGPVDPNASIPWPNVPAKMVLKMRQDLYDTMKNNKLDPAVQRAASSAYVKLSNALKNKVQGLDEADEMYTAVKDAQDFFKKTSGQEAVDSTDAAQGLVKNLEKSNNVSTEGLFTKQRYKQALDSLKDVTDTNENGEITYPGTDVANKIDSSMKGAVDQFGLVKDVNQPFGIKGTINSTVKSNLNRAGAMAGETANKTPQVVKDLGNGFSRSFPVQSEQLLNDEPEKTKPQSSIYNQANEKYADYSDRLNSNPTTAHLGAALKNAISSGNDLAKTQALFVIQQNPQAKKIISDSDDDSSNDNTMLS